MATQHNFRIKNGLEINGTERISSAGAGTLTNLTLSGNLTVQGTTVTLDATTLQVADKNIVLNYHASNDTSSAANGAGITIQDAVDGSTDATFLWNSSNDQFELSHDLRLDNARNILLERGGEIRSLDTGGSTRTIARINGSNDLEYGYSSSGAVKFMGGGSYTERMRIHTDGNISIGGYAPAFTNGGGLEIERADSATLRIQRYGADAAEIFMDSTGFNIKDLSHGTMLFGTANTERMRLNSTGLGIGLGGNNPATNARLHIKTSTDSGVNHGLVIERSANTDRGYINYQGGAFQIRSTVGDPINIGETDAVHIRIQPDGDVGIGTLTPDEFTLGTTYRYLAVGGTDKTGIINIIDKTTQGSYLQFGTAAGVRRASVHALDGSHLCFNTNTNNTGTSVPEKMRINNAGNVGINDTDPDRKLSIIGDSTSNGQYPLSLDATNTDYTLEFRRNGQSEWWIKQAGSSFNIHENGVGDALRIAAGGRVAIGSHSPGAQLDVHSGGSSDIVKFQNNNGSFLFGKTANLGSLDMASDANFRIRHGGTISATFTSSGDVLFGSTSNLNVLSGTPKIQVGSGSGHASMQFYSGTGSVAALYFGDATSGAARYSGYIEYRHNNDTMAFRASGTDQVVVSGNETKFTGRVELSNGKPIFSETDNGTHHYSHLCTGSFYQGSNQGVAINTNIPSYNVTGNNMFSFKIHGYTYDSTGGGVIDCTIGTYSGEGAFHNNSYTGQNIPKQWQGKIRLAKNSSDKVVILLGDIDTSTNYEIAVSCGVQGFYSVNPDYFSGWTCSAFTSTSAYSGITTVQPKETQMIGFAARSQGFTKTSGWSVISNSMTTVDYDFGGYLNTSNGRFTPLTRGMYLFSVGGYSTYSDSGGSSRYAFSFAKNSSTQHISGGNFCNQDSPLEGHSRMIYMNGSSDYVELRMYSSIGGSGITLGHPSHSMWWEAHLINQSNSAVSWSI